MAQFQVYDIGENRLVLDLQADWVSFGSRVVAPFLPLSQSPSPMKILEPEFSFNGERYVLLTPKLTAVPEALLGRPIADLSAFDYEIRRALDMVFSGF